MKLSQYTHLAVKTLAPGSYREVIQHGFTGLVTELGELVDIYKRQVYYKKQPDRDHLIEEVGDLMWYLAILAEAIGIPFPEEREIVIPEQYQGLSDFEILSKLSVHAVRGFSIAGDNFELAEPFTPEIIKRCLFWLKCFVDNHAIALEDAAEANIAKLARRYGDKFSEYRAINRVA